MGAPYDDLMLADPSQLQGAMDGSGLTADQRAALAAAVIGAPAPPSAMLQSLLSPLYADPPPVGLSPQDHANITALLRGPRPAQSVSDALQSLPGPISAPGGADAASLDPTNGLANGVGLLQQHQAVLDDLFGSGPSLDPAASNDGVLGFYASLYPDPPPVGLSPEDHANITALLGGPRPAQSLDDALQSLPGPILAPGAADPASLDPMNGLTNGTGLLPQHQASLDALLGRWPQLDQAPNYALQSDASAAPGTGARLGQGGPASSPQPPQITTADPHLGDLSMVYETGMRPGQEAAAAAKVSTGKADSGGASYGAFQFNSSPAKGAVVRKFLAGAGAPWASRFGNQDPTVPNGPFAQTWKSVAAQNPQAFFEAQRQFIQQTHYNPVVRKVMNATGLDINSRSQAVREAVWSTAVNHGAAAHLVAEAVGDVNKSLSPSDPGYDAALINKLYDVRQSYVQDPKVGIDPRSRPGLMSRYKRERATALAMLGT